MGQNGTSPLSFQQILEGKLAEHHISPTETGPSPTTHAEILPSHSERDELEMRINITTRPQAPRATRPYQSPPRDPAQTRFTPLDKPRGQAHTAQTVAKPQLTPPERPPRPEPSYTLSSLSSAGLASVKILQFSLEDSQTITLGQVKRAYRRLARELHPDLNPCQRHEAFHQLTEAYETLRFELKSLTEK